MIQPDEPLVASHAAPRIASGLQSTRRFQIVKADVPRASRLSSGGVARQSRLLGLLLARLNAVVKFRQ